ncbi:TFIIA-domain-containing protein [Acaromyces ingoldii]|uniref:Transcription initiation factor IIA large subunit n=1 Tax=Acaromyces ingoldii TaxID=215250 RepID=A0A316YNJ2_9BASI|nr:TFIIA-domain-containing protein [Acaromyces ingoldii]PWN90722.1 TFIIA-domain-containing protein [Acaromyces ingoldii]
MSNRAVSSTYRLVIDDVIANVRQDFEDMGIEREVLEELQRSWEAKIVATGVADFDGAGPAAPRRQREQQQQQSDTPKVKQEDDDGLHQSQSSQQASSSSSNKVARTNGSTSVKDGTAGEGSSGNGKSRDKGTSNGDGADGAEGEGGKRKRPADDDEIGSDLDDSDDEDFDGALDGDGDMILCLYDKVQRVRNKWKCVLKDGVASIDGRDYVFSKLGSELEW